MVEAVYLLWDDGVVVLKNEPLNVMGPQTLLFYRLGLEQQALVIRKFSSTLKKIHQIHTCIQNRHNTVETTGSKVFEEKRFVSTEN